MFPFVWYKKQMYIFLLFYKFLLQNSAIGHSSHLGFIGLQTFCPWVTKRVFISSQYFLGSFSRRAYSVSSGFFVFKYPKRLQILWTWTSTHIAGILYPLASTRFAVFLPTPLNFIKSSIVSGTLLSSSSTIIFEVCNYERNRNI